MVAVSGGFSVEGKFRPFGQRLKQSQQDPNYTQPAHKGRRVRARGEVISWAISRASPTRPDNHREAGHTRHHQTGYDCQPPNNRHYAFFVVPGHGLPVTQLTGWLRLK